MLGTARELGDGAQKERTVLRRVRAYMKQFLRLFSIIIAVVFALGMAQEADSREENLRSLMGSNFAHLQKILADLIRSDFSQVPKDVQVIEQHADELVKNIPDKIKQDKQMFIALADSLKTNAKNLRIVANLMAEHDKKAADPGKLNVDYLRNTAGANFGQVVTTCVACHNLFRREIVLK